MSRQEDFAKASTQFDGIYAQVAFSTGCEYGYQYAQTHPNWISVNDKLPKRNNIDRFSEIVIACTLDGQIDTTYYDFEKKEWGWMSNVTYWMILPQPPIKEDNE